MKKFIITKAVHLLVMAIFIVFMIVINTHWSVFLTYFTAILFVCYSIYVITTIKSFQMAVKQMFWFKPVSAHLNIDNIDEAYYLTQTEIVRIKPLYDDLMKHKPFFLNMELEPTYVFLATDNDFDLLQEIAIIDPDMIMRIHFYQTINQSK